MKNKFSEVNFRVKMELLHKKFTTLYQSVTFKYNNYYKLLFLLNTYWLLFINEPSAFYTAWQPAKVITAQNMETP